MPVFVAFGLVECFLLLPWSAVLLDVGGLGGVWRGLSDGAMYARLVGAWWLFLLFAALVMAGWCRAVQAWCAVRGRQGYVLPLILVLLPSTLVWWSPSWPERVALWLLHAGWMLLQQWVYERMRGNGVCGRADD